MSEHIDDKAFDEYLSRQGRISRQYRGLDGSGVPPELDRRVLDQAAQAVEKKHRGKAGAWRTWSIPVALAASTLLALAVVIESGVEPTVLQAPKEVSAREQRSAEPLASEADRGVDLTIGERPSAAAAPPATEAVEQSVDSAATERTKTEQAAEAKRRDVREEEAIEQVASRRQSQPVATQAAAPVIAESAQEPVEVESETPKPAPAAPPSTAITTIASRRSAVPPPAPAQFEAARDAIAATTENRAQGARNESDLQDIVVTGNSRRERTIIGPRGTLMRRDAPAEADSEIVSEQQHREENPARWLEFIRQLRRDRKTEEADRQWSEFRKIYPEYAVVDTDIARPQR